MEIKSFENKLWLSSPTMHGEELKYMKEAYDTNWMSTLGHNVDEVVRLACEVTGSQYAVPLSCGTAALHMAVKLAGVKQDDKAIFYDWLACLSVGAQLVRWGKDQISRRIL